MTSNPITYQEILAWDTLMRNGVSDFEVSCIRMLDGIRMKWINKGNDSG